MKYIIKRPPLLLTFEMPSREELLSLRKGDNAKLIFSDKNGENVERMWVKLTKIDKEGGEWKGELDNEPLGLKIKYRQKIIFHPFDIIDVL